LSTSTYRIMNDATAVKIFGTRSRSKPVITSGSGVVAASTPVASRPKLAFSTIDAADSRPATDSGTPRTWTSWPVARNGSRTTKNTNGISTTSRRSNVIAGIWAVWAAAASTTP